MIKNPGKLREFEDATLKNDRGSFAEKLVIIEALYREARAMGHFTPDSRLDGVEVKIEIARVVNSV